MPKKREPLSFDRVRCYPLEERKSKVRARDFARPWKAGGTLEQWFNSLPHVLAGKDLKRVVKRLVEAVRDGRTVILAMGAHGIKVGLGPIIVELMERGVLHAVAMNGAGIIHDFELAMSGGTSEDVAAEIGRGRFGMAEETGRFLNSAIKAGEKEGVGLGTAVGAMMVREDFPHNRWSIVARAYQLDVPVTVHVALGTDIIHGHPGVDGGAIGRASHLDFRIFAQLVSELNGGVFINLGSAVILPEVFLKALSIVRNLGYEVKDLMTVNMDFIRHYRPMMNVVRRPTLEGGEGYNLIGHHEIMFPLLAACVIEGLSADKA